MELPSRAPSRRAPDYAGDLGGQDRDLPAADEGHGRDPPPQRQARGPARTSDPRESGVWHVDRVLRPWSYAVHSWVWRNWCGARSPIRFAITVGTDRRSRRGWRVPPCRESKRRSRLADLGPGTRPLPRQGSRIPAQVLGREVPVPLSPSLITVKNGWIAADGYTLVAVYASASGGDRHVGMLAVIRQNSVFGTQSCDVVDAGRSGAARITSAPHGKAVETSAQRGVLSFSTTSGFSGTLRLRNDSVGRSSRRPAPCRRTAEPPGASPAAHETFRRGRCSGAREDRP